MTEGSHCSVCGEIIVAQQAIAAYGYELFAEIDYEETVGSQTYTYTYSISVAEDYSFAMYIIGVCGEDYTYNIKYGEISLVDDNIYKLVYSDGSSSEYIAITSEGFAFVNSDGTDCGKTEVEKESWTAAKDIAASAGNSTYGYYALANDTNGLEMQRLYYTLYRVSEGFSNYQSDITATDSQYIIYKINLSDYSLTAEQAVSVWKVFYLENPVYYWLANSLTITGGFMAFCIDGEYCCYADRLQYNSDVAEMFAEAAALISEDMTELDIAMTIHDYIIGKIDYAYQSDGTTPETAIWAHNIIGVSSKGYGVCEAYAKTYLALCLASGLDCVIVSGYASGETHAWNLVKIDGEWYGVDCTWDDTGTSDVSYACFGMSASSISAYRTADTSSEYGTDYLYDLPKATNWGAGFVTLYKGEEDLGLYINIDAAFAAMTDSSADYTIELYAYTYSEADHYIYSEYSPVVSSITIQGILTDWGNGFFSVTPLYIDSNFTLNSNLEIYNIDLVVTELDLGEYTLTTSGYYCVLSGTIYDNKTTDNISIKDNTSYETEIYAELDISYFYGYTLFRSTTYISMYSGSYFIVYGGNVTIDNCILSNEHYGSIGVEQGGTLSINSLNYENPEEDYSSVYITLQFDSLESYPALYLGDVNVELQIYLNSSVTYEITDLDGNTAGTWTVTTDPFEVDVIATLGNADDFNNIIIYVLIEESNYAKDCTELYGVNENNQIVMVAEKVDDCFYIRDGKLIAYTGTDSVITIPDEVTVIGEEVFYYNDTLTSVTIQEGVTSINEAAFAYCSSLTTVNLPDSLLTVGGSAFEGCSSLVSVNVPDSVTYIGGSAFYNCTSLTNVTIGEGVTYIGANAFYCCTSLESVTLSEKVTYIGANAFYCCSSLTEIVIPDSVTYIGSGALHGCSALQSITLPFVGSAASDAEYTCFGYIFGTTFYDNGFVPSSLKYVTLTGGVIYEYAFSLCSSIESVTLGDGLTSVSEYAFYYCTSLKTVNLPEGVTSIGVNAFYNCASLTSINIPESVTSIGDQAFDKCTSIETIYFDAKALDDLSEYNYVFFNAGQESGGVTIYIGENVTKIPDYMFCQSQYILNVVFDDGGICQSIGDHAFSGCISLNSVNIPDSVTTIGDYAFNYCTSLENIDIPDEVASIGHMAFYNCTSLTSVTIGEGVVYIGSYSFNSCYALEQINYNAISAYDLSVSDYVFENAGKNAEQIILNIGAKVKNIPDYLFYSQWSSAHKITSVVFETGSVLERIGDYAFWYSESLAEINIPDTVTYIGEMAFYSCASLESVNIPESLTCIGDNAFRDCTSLTKVYYGGTASQWAGIAFEGNTSNPLYYAGYLYLGGDLATDITLNADINAYAFCGCLSITSVAIESGSTCVGPQAFYGCTSLVSMSMANGVTSIGNYAFYGCTSLKDIDIGSGVTSIGENAFRECTALTEIYYNAAVVEELSQSNVIFYNAGVEGGGIELTIGKNVAQIPANLFYAYGNGTYAANLTSIVFEDGGVCESIGVNAFYACYALTSVEIGDAVTSIGYGAFRSCTSLESLTIGKAVTSIDNYAFYGCKSLKSIYYNAIAMGTISQTYNIFYNAGQESGGITIYVGADVTKIPSYLFWGYSSLCGYAPMIIGVEFESGGVCASIDDFAFAYCSSLYSVTLDENLTSIGNNAFAYCSSLAAIDLPDGLLSIGSYAFMECSSIKTIEVPDSVTYICSGAFYLCSALESVTLPFVGYSLDDQTNNSFSYIFNSVPSSLKTVVITGGTEISDSAFRECTGITSITLPDGITSIGSRAFYYCSSLETVNIPEGVTSIGDYVFYCCSSLTNITIPEGVTCIGEYAFFRCSALASATLPTTITLIGDSAFYECASLISITIPVSVTNIGNSAFNGCTALKQIIFNAKAAEDLSENNYVFYYAGQESGGIAVTIGSQVTNIPDYLFCPTTWGYPEIASVTIESGSALQRIGDYAFYCCSGITSVSVESLSYIGERAFNECTSLESFTAGDGLTYIGQWAFNNCASLKNVSLGSGATEICYSAFNECTSLESFTIGYGATYIGSYAFYNCSSLISIVIPDSVTAIGSSAFCGCSSLQSITLPFIGPSSDSSENLYIGYIFGANAYYSNVSYVPSTLDTVVITGGADIASYAFSGCENIKYITIGSGASSIGEYAFKYCLSLISVNIPDTVTTIENYAFIECTALASITIPESVTKIGDYAFYYCTGLTEINFNANLTEELTSENNIFRLAGRDGGGLVVTIGANVEKVPAYLFCYSEQSVKITEAKFESGSICQSIGDYAFGYCIYLTSINIPDTVKTIGEGAFFCCSLLTGTIFGENSQVETIGDYAFYICSSIVNIVIPDTATSIGDYAFYNCSALESIVIGDGVEAIGTSVLAYCPSLKSLTAPFTGSSAENAEYTNFGYLFGVTSYNEQSYSMASALTDVTITGDNDIAAYAFYNCSVLTSIAITGNVSSVGSYAFYCCYAAETIAMPDTVEAIGEYAFYGCNSLASINLPNSLTSISDYMFYSCNSLTSVVIPDSVISIGYDAFWNCSSITDITIGSKVETIGAGAFYNCRSVSSLVIPNSVTSLGDGAFQRCVELQSITLPENIAEITAYLFYDCSSLASINIPEGVTFIGDYAFYNCTSLASVKIPEEVTYIGDYAFYYCTALTTINFDAAAMDDLLVDNNIFFCAGQEGGGITVTIGENVTYVPAYLFDPSDTTSYSPKITSIVFENGNVNTTIGEYAFYECVYLTSLTLSDNVTSIGQYAFCNCKLLTSLDMGEGLTSIGEYAFFGCSSLANVVVPDSVKYIGAKSFGGCISLESVTLPFLGSSSENEEYTNFDYIFTNGGYYSSSLTTVIITGGTAIADDAFLSCSSLENVILPETIVSIGRLAFAYCSSLKSIVIPDSVITIGNSAFANCVALESLTIGSGVTSIGNGAFSKCTALTEIFFNAVEMDDLSEDNQVFYCVGQSNNGITVTIGSKVTKIPAYLFYPYTNSGSYIPNIKSVLFADGCVCKSIGSYAFCYCNALKSITIPQSITAIDEYAFLYCYKLIEVCNLSTLDITAESIDNGFVARYAKNVYSSASGQSNLIYEGDYVFYNDEGTYYLIDYVGTDTDIILPDNIKGCNYSIYEYAFAFCGNLTSVTISDGVTSIGANSFEFCISIKSVIMPDSVLSIDDFVFYHCSSLTDITLSDNLTIISRYAFADCVALEYITIPDSVTAIYDTAFYNCTSLKSVVIPTSLSNVYYNAFSGCVALESVYYNGTADEWSEISFGGSYSDPTCYDATIYYYSASEPNYTDDYYWYYDENGDIAVWT
ncbi:MAG: leucine-rich repeat protein [Clostridia bacterium]|nr:leucine-rich repeat protein [Clostridia bacterium]